jgi:hypothetical protein
MLMLCCGMARVRVQHSFATLHAWLAWPVASSTVGAHPWAHPGAVTRRAWIPCQTTDKKASAEADRLNVVIE